MGWRKLNRRYVISSRLDSLEFFYGDLKKSISCQIIYVIMFLLVIDGVELRILNKLRKWKINARREIIYE